MVAYATRVPSGFPGSISRQDSLTVVAEQIDSGTPPTAYGKPVKIVAGKVQPIASADSATVVAGFSARSFPLQSTTNALGSSAPPTSGLLDVMRRGFMAVTLNSGTAARHGQVYVCINVAGGAIGDIQAATSANNVAIAGCFFEGPADAGGVVEISYNI